MSLVRGLESVADLYDVTFHTCSKYVYYAVIDRSYEKWIYRYHGKTITGEERHNLDLWDRVDSYLANHNINFYRADHLARQAANNPQLVDEFYEASDAGRSYKESMEWIRDIFSRNKPQLSADEELHCGEK